MFEIGLQVPVYELKFETKRYSKSCYNIIDMLEYEIKNNINFAENNINNDIYITLGEKHNIAINGIEATEQEIQKVRYCSFNLRTIGKIIFINKSSKDIKEYILNDIKLIYIDESLAENKHGDAFKKLINYIIDEDKIKKLRNSIKKNNNDIEKFNDFYYKIFIF